MAAFFLRPGVFPETIDLTERAEAISTSVGALVFASRKGSLTPKLITDKQFAIDQYLKPDASWSKGMHSMLAFLINARAAYGLRVVKYARYAGARIVNDKEGAVAAQTYYSPFPSGPYKDFENGGQQYQHIVFAGPLTAANLISVTITDGTTTITVTQEYATSNDNTLQLLASALTTQINTTYANNHVAQYKNPGSVSVISGGSLTTDNRILRVVVPEGVTLDFSGAVTLGTNPPAVTFEDNPWLFEIYAENPGAWANDIGFQIRNIDQGIKQKRKLAFTGTIAVGQVFQATLDYKGSLIQIGPVTAATSHNNALNQIRTAILAAFGEQSGNAFVEVVDAAGNKTEIIVTAPEDGTNIINIFDPIFTGNGTLPTVAVTQTVPGLDKSDTFELWIFNRSNIITPAEKHVVSFREQIDGFGEQQYIEEVINTSAAKSDIIRVRYNTLNKSGLLVNLPNPPNTIQWLTGGDDGLLPDSADLVQAWDKFKDRANYNVRILINAGNTQDSVQAKMVEIAEKRRDCFAILDVPSASQEVQAAVAWRDNIGFSSSYAAAYLPDVKIRDEFTNRTLFVPPSGYVAAIFAYTDAVAAEWFAPAGMNRALVRGVIGLRHEYSTNDEEILFPKQLNAIVKRPGKGYPLMGAETLQSKASALRNINVRRMLITVEVSFVDALDYTVYEPNDPYTQFQVVQIGNNLLDPIKTGRGLLDYLIISNDSNNKPYHKDLGQLNIDVLMKPVIPVKYIKLSSVITRTGAAFNEIIGLLNG